MDKKILNQDMRIIIGLGKVYGAKKIILFGSCLDNIRKAQDIDIAVSGVRSDKFFEFYGKISSAIKDQVDLIDLGDLRDNFLNSILSKGKIVYESAS